MECEGQLPRYLLTVELTPPGKKATFIEAARRLLPDYPPLLICFHIPYARHFLDVPALGFNILQKSLVGPCGSRFLRRARDAERPVMVWTVNDERWMEWCLRKNAAGGKGASTTTTTLVESRLIDGVITDNPKLFLEVCKRWEDEQDEQDRLGASRPGRRRGGVGASPRDMLYLLAFPVFVRLIFLLGRWRGKFDYFKNAKRLER